MIREFFDYWSEPNKSHSKMRFEQERTWDLSRRLQTWEKRSRNGFSKYNTDKSEANYKAVEAYRNESIQNLKPMDSEEQMPI